MQFTNNGIPIDCLLFHWYHWYQWYQWYQSTSSYRAALKCFICSLQMEHRSAAFFSIDTIGSNGTNRQMVYARPSGVNVCSLQIVYQSTNYFSNGIEPMAPIDKSLTHGSQVVMRCSFSNGIPMDSRAFQCMVPMVY